MRTGEMKMEDTLNNVYSEYPAPWRTRDEESVRFDSRTGVRITESLRYVEAANGKTVCCFSDHRKALAYLIVAGQSALLQMEAMKDATKCP